MKKENLILIIHIALQVILFIPIIPFLKYYQELEMGVFIAIYLSIINFIAYVITILNDEKEFVLNYSLLTILFIIFMFIEDLILRDLLIGKYIELMIYNLLLFGNLELIYSIKKINITRTLITIVIAISAIIINYNYMFSSLLFKSIFIILLISPCILWLINKNIRKYHSNSTIFLQIGFFISFIIYIYFTNIEIISISEYLLLSLVFMELILLYKIISTNIKDRILLFINAMRKLLPGYTILFIILFLVGMPLRVIVIISLYFFIFLTEFRSYRKYRNYKLITFDEVLEGYYYEKYKDTELEKLNILKIQTFLHDDILQIIIAIRRWIEDNLTGSGKDYILQNLEKLNDLIRHEIDSFNPKLKDYKSLYQAYNRLISDLEDMYLNKQMLIEFECDQNLNLPTPYDELVYKCINELLINAFKHSKGYNTHIILKVENSTIYLIITNIGDYINDENKIKDGNIGLNVLRLNLKQYRGIFTFNIFNDDENSEESYVQFKIDIPMDRSAINENLINRRS